ncbi:hypothetical protein FPOAC2_13212 [Fusarium poae]
MGLVLLFILGVHSRRCQTLSHLNNSKTAFFSRYMQPYPNRSDCNNMSSPSETSESPHSAQSNKRKANGPPTESQVKRRAARACLRCRNRKVRCDVTSSGVPCNNCRLDAEDCLLVETNRGKPRSSSNWTDPRLTLVNEKDAEDLPVSLTFDGKKDEHAVASTVPILDQSTKVGDYQDIPLTNVHDKRVQQTSECNKKSRNLHLLNLIN